MDLGSTTFLQNGIPVTANATVDDSLLLKILGVFAAGVILFFVIKALAK